MSYFESIREFHRLNVEPLIGRARGCTPDAIEALEAELGFGLPAAYREYLAFMGRDVEGILVGTDCFIDDVVQNNAGLRALLAENRIDFELPPQYVTFFMHQGYQAAWFDAPAAPDPECWFFLEGEMGSPEKVGTLAEFVRGQLEGLLPCLVALHPPKGGPAEREAAGPPDK